MDIAEVQKFVAENHRGVLVARKRDGWPQLTLVTPAVDGVAKEFSCRGRQRGCDGVLYNS
jgi:hypothetical protein